MPKEALTEDAAINLERLCGSPGDGIRVAAPVDGIERIEARLHGKVFEPHRHDTYALGVTLGGIQTFQYRGESRYSTPGSIIIIHPDELHDGGAGTEATLRYRMMYLQPERLIAALGDSGGALPIIAAPVVGDVALRQAIGEAVMDLDGGIDELALDDILTRIAEGLCRHAGTTSKAAGRSAKRAVSRRRTISKPTSIARSARRNSRPSAALIASPSPASSARFSAPARTATF